MERASRTRFWLIFAAIYLIGVVVVWSIGPETKGRSLDEVHGEA